MNEVRLSRSGWVARGWTLHGVWLDYEGKEFKRSCHVIRYDNGTFGYDWPEVVPASVKRKVERLLEVNR